MTISFTDDQAFNLEVVPPTPERNAYEVGVDLYAWINAHDDDDFNKQDARIDVTRYRVSIHTYDLDVVRRVRRHIGGTFTKQDIGYFYTLSGFTDEGVEILLYVMKEGNCSVTTTDTIVTTEVPDIDALLEAAGLDEMPMKEEKNITTTKVYDCSSVLDDGSRDV